ncbi:PQQ-like beta-propeller repeat protein [Halobacterium litoreum]|uniref:PQQ-binding-like beta-propeller repeat protein n=1 Tax=Halobacterium litoreum TaxID=2039234 RepID=A0ABD5NIC7_9EURY|nr:PQQ-like beta-propeller repeat protein [Halobacterium litoreum]UHH12266.1 PQQ-like beta-propeller repeat protein [Halobacterium litoreum]
MVGRRDALALVGSALAGTVAGCSALSGGTDGGSDTTAPEPDSPSFDGPAWPSPGGGPRNRGQAAGGTGPEDGGRVAWTTTLSSLSMYGPTLAGNTLFHGDVGTLEAFAAADGSTRWSREPTQANTPTFHDGSVYAPSADDGLVAADAVSGDTTWRFGQSGAFAPTTTVADDTLYAVTRDGRVLALDPATREERWRTDAGSVNAIGVADGVVYARAGPGLAAFVDGEFEWRLDIPGGSDLPVVGDDNVYARDVAAGGTVYAVDRTSGERQWTYEGGGDSFAPSVAYADGRVAFAAGSTVAVLDAATGDPVWEKSTDGAGGVAVGGDTVYAALPDALAAFDAADGTQRWRASVGADTTVAGAGQPLVVGDRVYAPLGTTLAAIDPA